jgi:hypothetical protein
VDLAELHDVDWGAIDEQLAHDPDPFSTSISCNPSEVDNYSSPLKSSGWVRSPVTISVPYHAQMADSGHMHFAIKPGFLH